MRCVSIKEGFSAQVQFLGSHCWPPYGIFYPSDARNNNIIFINVSDFTMSFTSFANTTRSSSFSKEGM
jgi:hypothetical protein